MGMVYHPMDHPAHQLVSPPAQHLFSGGVDEGSPAIRVNAIDAFPDRMQDELVLPFHVLEQFFHPPPFQQATPVIAVGLVALPERSQ